KLLLGLLALATGRSREAADHSSTVGGSVPAAVAARAGLARLPAASGDLAAAERQVAEGLTLSRGKGVRRWAAGEPPRAAHRRRRRRRRGGAGRGRPGAGRSRQSVGGGGAAGGPGAGGRSQGGTGRGRRGARRSRPGV